jgi:hypothetical protein
MANPKMCEPDGFGPNVVLALKVHKMDRTDFAGPLPAGRQAFLHRGPTVKKLPGGQF